MCHEYAAMTSVGVMRPDRTESLTLPGQQAKVYLVGGRSKDGRSLRSVFCYDLASATWSRLSDMKEVSGINKNVFVS